MCSACWQEVQPGEKCDQYEECRGAKIVTIRKPIKPPPPYKFDTQADSTGQEILEGTCCACGRTIRGTRESILFGTCPYCGHTGFMPPALKSSVAIDEEINQMFKKK